MGTRHVIQNIKGPITLFWVQSIDSTKGETLGMRLPAGFENAMQDDDQQLISTLHFDEGGMRGLAAAIVWCGLVYFVDTLGDDKVCDPQVVALSRSLLGIPTYFKHQESDPARAMIGRIIRQNVEAKKLAVSSFEWSQILASMVADGEKVTVAMAVEMYNNNPEVAAHGAGGKDRTSKQIHRCQSEVMVNPQRFERTQYPFRDCLLRRTSMS